MNRLPVSPLVTRGIQIALKRIGMDELSRRIDAPAETIKAWMFGHTAMPDHKFATLVDVLLELDPKWMDDVKKP